jgi:hypothetical protein
MVYTVEHVARLHVKDTTIMLLRCTYSNLPFDPARIHPVEIEAAPYQVLKPILETVQGQARQDRHLKPQQQRPRRWGRRRP